MAGAALSTGLFALLVVQLARQWDDSGLRPADLDWPALAVALGAAALPLAAVAAVWGQCLRAVGERPPRGLVAAFFVGQLAKYLPGGVWQYVGRAGIATRQGVPLRAASAALGLETVGMILGLALLMPLVLADDAAGAALALALAALALIVAAAASRTGRVRAPARRALARIAGPGVRIRPAAVRAALAGYVGCGVLLGLAFWLVARALIGVPLADLPLYTGAIAVAWVAGFAAVLAPGGIGVREAVLVGLLGPRIGAADALVVATGSRILFTLVDLIGGLAGLWALRRRTAPQPAGAG